MKVITKIIAILIVATIGYFRYIYKPELKLHKQHVNVIVTSKEYTPADTTTMLIKSGGGGISKQTITTPTTYNLQFKVIDEQFNCLRVGNIETVNETTFKNVSIGDTMDVIRYIY